MDFSKKGGVFGSQPPWIHEKGVVFQERQPSWIRKIMHDIYAIFVTYIFIKCNTIIKLYTEKKDELSMFLSKKGFLKVKFSTFSRKKGG